MFTGLVEETGTLCALTEYADSWQLTLEAQRICEGLSIGDSLACNGCCLTVTQIHAKQLTFDVLEETLRLTHFGQLKIGDAINLERSVAVGQRMGGHFVTGHIDTRGEILSRKLDGKNTRIHIKVDKAYHKYLVYKGCICVDGISLTVADTDKEGFTIWLIPHTLEQTNLHQRETGDRVNLEFDLLAKYVENIKFLSNM